MTTDPVCKMGWIRKKRRPRPGMRDGCTTSAPKPATWRLSPNHRHTQAVRQRSIISFVTAVSNEYTRKGAEAESCKLEAR